MSSLGMDLSRVLFEHEPKLLACDAEASARAAAQVSNLLGCVMAVVMMNNPEGYEAAFKEVMLKVHESAQLTAAKAVAMAPEPATSH